MKFASGLSERPTVEEAVRECAAKVEAALDGPPDLAGLFVSQHFQADYEDAPKLLDRLLKPKHLIGCSAGGVIGAGREVEHKPGVALVAATLPGVSLSPFRLEMDALPDSDAPPGAWAKAVGVPDRTSKPQFLILADPFTFNPEDLVRGLDYAFPQSVKIGGLASGALRPGQNMLIVDGALQRAGAVGLACAGNLVIDPIVAQGCRPVGKSLQITECHQNHLVSLDGKPALKAVEDLLESLPEEDQQLARTSLFLGIVSDSFRAGSKRDFLIRNLVGLDPENGTIAIGALLRPGQTVQFHLRDKRASAQDLELMLGRYAKSKPSPPPAGALLFSCLGRGKHLYGVANHDSDAFQQKLGPLPMGGFFCNGEIGPVEGATRLHGYTSCFAIFRPAA